MNKSRNFISIFIPGATVFISSFCIMAMELVAGRLTSRYLGSSLYTWTAVIGVILTGITIGNYLGGRIADKFPPKKSIALLFAACSAACVLTVILNNTAKKWMWPWQFNWPVHVFIHVSLVFLLPSTLLGMISPVVAKMALDRGLPTGRTIGDIYAWGAAGSIAGTFAAGYWLIAAMGTIKIIWVIGAALLLMSILYQIRLWPLYIWAAVFTALMTIAMIPAGQVKNTASSLGLREPVDPNILYENESQYFHITVKQAGDTANRRDFCQDKLVHSKIIMDDVLNLQYSYTKIYALVTEELGRNKKTLSVMAIGGGGYVFPRYVEKIWPGSRIDVVEIDPAVTKAATEAFGLEKNTTINTINTDARNYIDELLERKRNGRETVRYDFIYGDAINNFSVPFQLVTLEFNEKIFTLLGDDGVYMVNLIDIFDSGLFLGSVAKTLEKTFPYVYVATEDADRSIRNTFVIIAAKHKLDLKNIISQSEKGRELNLWYPDISDTGSLGQKSRYLVLTDNYCPVENLLTPVVRGSEKEIADIFHKRAEENIKRTSVQKYLARARELQQKGLFAESIESYLSAIEANPAVSIQSYNEIGIMYARMGKPEQAAEAFNKAIRYNDASEHKTDMTRIYYNLGLALKKSGKSEQAAEQFNKVIAELHKELSGKPAYYEGWKRLGNTLTAAGDFKAAAEAFKKAIALNSDDIECYDGLVKALEKDGRGDEAIEELKKYIQQMKYNKQDKAALQLQRYLDSLEYNKNK